MTRAEAVNWIINISADIGKSQHSDLWHYEQVLTEIKEMLESDVPDTNVGKWTPCSKGSPKEGTYLCWEKQGFYYVDTFKGGNWELSDTAGAICIAWMPLPEPYQEEKS